MVPPISLLSWDLNADKPVQVSPNAQLEERPTSCLGSAQPPSWHQSYVRKVRCINLVAWIKLTTEDGVFLCYLGTLSTLEVYLADVLFLNDFIQLSLCIYYLVDA